VATPLDFFASIIRLSSSIVVGQFRLFDVVSRVYGLGQFFAVVSFIFNLICIVTDERTYLIQIGCPGALSVREAV
jgi:hypothetical protein